MTTLSDLDYTETPPTEPGWYAMRFKRPWQDPDVYEYRIVKVDYLDPLKGYSYPQLHVVEPPIYRARISSVWSDLYTGWEWSDGAIFDL